MARILQVDARIERDAQGQRSAMHRLTDFARKTNKWLLVRHLAGWDSDPFRLDRCHNSSVHRTGSRAGTPYLWVGGDFSEKSARPAETILRGSSDSPTDTLINGAAIDACSNTPSPVRQEAAGSVTAVGFASAGRP
jgi:hypothetical protein